MRFYYRATECTFVQFLSAFLASAVAFHEADVLRVLGQLIIYRDAGDRFPADLIGDVLDMTGNHCVMVQQG